MMNCTGMLNWLELGGVKHFRKAGRYLRHVLHTRFELLDDFQAAHFAQGGHPLHHAVDRPVFAQHTAQDAANIKLHPQRHESGRRTDQR